VSDVDCSTEEILASFIARDLDDGLWVNVGANLDVPRAGVLLAHLTHAPNMRVHMGLTRTNLADVPVIPATRSTTDWRAARWAESFLVHSATYDNNKHRTNGAFFIGGLQVDPYGNTNLIGIGTDHSRLKVRGPGGLGTGYMAAYVKRLYIYVASHSPRTFVQECDFVSALGWRRDGLDRAELGLPGGGPRFCITPKCVMDYERGTGRARLHSVHPGHTVEEIIESTGFQLVLPEHVPVTPSPSPEDLHILRTRIDTEGLLRG
jgi:glutaconate CoA-transferase, subunit B